MLFFFVLAWGPPKIPTRPEEPGMNYGGNPNTMFLTIYGHFVYIARVSQPAREWGQAMSLVAKDMANAFIHCFINSH